MDKKTVPAHPELKMGRPMDEIMLMKMSVAFT